MKLKLIQAFTLGILALISISAHADDQSEEVKFVYLKSAALMAPGGGVLVGGQASAISKHQQSRRLSNEAAAAAESGHRANAVRLLKQSRELEEKSLKTSKLSGLIGLSLLVEGIYLSHQLVEHAKEAMIVTQKNKAAKANQVVADTYRQPAESTSGSAR